MNPESLGLFILSPQILQSRHRGWRFLEMGQGRVSVKRWLREHFLPPTSFSSSLPPLFLPSFLPSGALGEVLLTANLVLTQYFELSCSFWLAVNTPSLLPGLWAPRDWPLPTSFSPFLLFPKCCTPWRNIKKHICELKDIREVCKARMSLNRQFLG